MAAATRTRGARWRNRRSRRQVADGTREAVDRPWGPGARQCARRDALWLLDWEYAQLADPLYDVACVLAYYPQAQPHADELAGGAGLTGAGVAARLEAAMRVYDGLSELWLWVRASPRAD